MCFPHPKLDAGFGEDRVVGAPKKTNPLHATEIILVRSGAPIRPHPKKNSSNELKWSTPPLMWRTSPSRRRASHRLHPKTSQTQKAIRDLGWKASSRSHSLAELTRDNPPPQNTTHTHTLKYNFRFQAEDILSIAFAPPSTLATSGYDGVVLVWNMDSGVVKHTLSSPEDSVSEVGSHRRLAPTHSH